MRPFLLFALAVSGALPHGVDARPGFALESSRDLWRDPDFRGQLLRSFGTLGDVEPPLAEEEEVLYAELIELVGEKPQEARDRILDHLRANPDASALFDFAAANVFFNEGNNVRAAALFNAAIEKHAEFRRAHKNLGLVYFRMEKFDQAIRHLSKAVELGENNGTVYGVLASACLASGRYAQAESGFRNAILFQPDVVEWQMSLAESLRLQDRHEGAAAILGKMIEEDPANRDLWEMQARAYLGAEQNLKAATNYEFLDGIGALDAAGLKLLGDIYREEKMFGLAAESYARSFANEENADPTAVLQSAELLIARGGGAEAAQLLKKIGDSEGLERDSKVTLLRLRAQLAQGQNDPNQAASLLEEALDLSPTDGKSVVMFGEHLRVNGQLDRAELVFSRALDLEGFEAQSRLGLAQTFVGKEDYKKAIELLQQALNELDDPAQRDSVGRYLSELERFQKSRGG